MRMKRMATLVAAVMLFVMAVPAVVSAETINATPPAGADIWISVSPTEVHPAELDRSGAVLPFMDSYRVRVAVYSDPYTYINEVGEEVIIDIPGYDFDVTSLEGVEAVLRDPESDEGVAPLTIHKENDQKWTYVFQMGDLKDEGGVTKKTELLKFEADGHTGIDKVKIKGGGGGSPTDTPGNGGNGGYGGR